MKNMRAAIFLRASLRAGDWGALVLVGVVALIYVRLLLMPFLPSIQRAAIDRFHLTTPSFVLWAIQQPIPPMYNLENQVWFSRRALTDEELLLAKPLPEVQYEYINHFPIRKVTFAGSRYRCFKDERSGWLYLRSRYQETVKTTVWRIESNDDDTMTMTLVETKFHDPVEPVEVAQP